MQLQLYRYQITIKNLSLFLLPAVQQYCSILLMPAVHQCTATASGTVMATVNSTIKFNMGSLFFG